MTRNLKALGLALVAVFAMGAVVASAASAQGALTVEGPATLHAESSEHKFTSPSGTIECTENTFSATGVENKDEAVTIVPTYGGNCTIAGQPGTVDVNGCHLVLDDATTTESGDYAATVDIDCSTQEGSPGIVITTFAGGGHGFQVCKITVPAQTGIGPVTISNGGGSPDDLVLSGTIKGVNYTKSGLCGIGSGVAEYDLGTTTLTASNSGGPTNLTISD